MSCPGGAYHWAPEIPSTSRIAGAMPSKCETGSQSGGATLTFLLLNVSRAQRDLPERPGIAVVMSVVISYDNPINSGVSALK
jgi:hypothetical protein